jgi:hypothetical protein
MNSFHAFPKSRIAAIRGRLSRNSICSWFLSSERRTLSLQTAGVPPADSLSREPYGCEMDALSGSQMCDTVASVDA